MNWDRCRGWLLPALTDGTEADLLADLAKGRAQLWEGRTAAFVTQCIHEPAGPTLHAWLAGGELRELLAMIPGIEAWGRTQGCERATVTGRPGWRRVLSKFGYRQIGDELVKGL